MPNILKALLSSTIILLLFCCTTEAQQRSDYLIDLKEQLLLQWPDNKRVNRVFHGHSVPAGYFKTPKINTLAAYPDLCLKRYWKSRPDNSIHCSSHRLKGETLRRLTITGSEKGMLKFNTILRLK